MKSRINALRPLSKQLSKSCFDRGLITFGLKLGRKKLNKKICVLNPLTRTTSLPDLLISFEYLLLPEDRSNCSYLYLGKFLCQFLVPDPPPFHPQSYHPFRPHSVLEIDLWDARLANVYLVLLKKWWKKIKKKFCNF